MALDEEVIDLVAIALRESHKDARHCHDEAIGRPRQSAPSSKAASTRCTSTISMGALMGPFIQMCPIKFAGGFVAVLWR